MLDVNKNTRRTHPSLLPLRMALTAAKSGSPARSPHTVTVDERRALSLIEKMKAEYSKPLSFMSWKDDSTLNGFRLQKVIGSHV